MAPTEKTPLIKQRERNDNMPGFKMDSKPVGERKISSTLKQVLLCIVSNFSLIGAGMGLGYTAVALPYMKQPSSPVPVNIIQASWIASLSSIATPLGCLTIGPILDKYGRRTALLLITIPLIIGWSLISIFPTIERIYLGRIATGISTGFASVSSTVYVTEIAGVKLRGLLIIGGSMAISLGITIVYILGLVLKERWQLVAVICAIFPVVSFFLILLILPESPVWLVGKRRFTDAKKSLKTIHNYSTPEEADAALEELSLRMSSSKKTSMSFKNALKALTVPETYKPLFIMNFFFFFQQASGTFVIIFYAVDVVRTTNVTVDAFVVTVFIGLTRLLFTAVSAWMSKSLGRRPTSVISGAGMTLSLLVLASYAYIQSIDYISNGLLPENSTELNNTTESSTNVTNSMIVPTAIVSTTSLIPIIMLLFYVMFGTLGFLTLPWSMIGEVYPDRVRGLASGLTTSIAYVINFFTIKLYPTMNKTMNTYGVFGFYGCMAFLGTIFVFIFLPETEGKTLKEIEEKFANKSKRPSQIEEEETLHNSRLLSIVKSQQTQNLN